MSTPRRPSAGRPPAGRRPARAGARSAGQRTPAARPAGTAGGRTGRRTRLRSRLSTGRIAVLVLVAVTLVTSAALPLREFFEQRGDIAALAQRNAEARARVSALEGERERLQDPDFVAAEARRRLHFVRPGETAYVLLHPSTAPGGASADGEVTAQDPWYSQLWSSVREADRLAPAG